MGTGTELQKWGSYEVEAAAKEQEALSKEGGGVGFMKLEVGKNRVRIFPPAPGRTSPFVVTFQHYVDLPDGKKYTFACPRVMEKKPCPVCNHAAKLQRSGTEADKARARELSPSRRVYCVVLDRRNPDAGPQILGFGKMVHEQLVALRQDEDMGGDFTHPVNGIDVIIERTGDGKFNTRYNVNLARNSGPIVDDAALMDELRVQMPDLSRYSTVPSEAEITARLSGESAEDARAAGNARRAGGGRPRQQRANAQMFDAADITDAEFTDDTDDADGDWTR